MAAVGAEVAERWPPKERKTPPLPTLLDQLCAKQAEVQTGGDRLTPFNHYRLVDWLTWQRAVFHTAARSDRSSAS